MSTTHDAVVSGAGTKGGFIRSAMPGRWAAEQFERAQEAGQPLTASLLRQNASLRKDEWKFYDRNIVEEGAIRLRGVRDLIEGGLERRIPNGIGKTLYEWEQESDMEDAIVSMDGRARSDDDTIEYILANLPMAIIHKDFNIDRRRLEASRSEGGPGLDATQARLAGRRVTEKIESLLFQGGPTFAGSTIYGYRTHPDRNQGNFEASGGSWANGSKTGAQCLADVLTMRTALEADRFYGPYWLYVPSGFSTTLEEDFKTESDKSVRQRLLEVDRLERITVVDQLPADEAIMVQGTMDVVELITGEPLQTVQWDLGGPFEIAMKAFAISIPLIKSTAAGRSGVYHMTVA